MKTSWSAPRASDTAWGSPSNRTMTLNKQQRQSRSGLGTTLWMSLSGPERALTWTQSNISGETWIWNGWKDSPHPAWQSLRGSAAMFEACRVRPKKKTWCCNRCQRCFNQAQGKALNTDVRVKLQFFLLNTFANTSEILFSTLLLCNDCRLVRGINNWNISAWGCNIKCEKGEGIWILSGCSVYTLFILEGQWKQIGSWALHEMDHGE